MVLSKKLKKRNRFIALGIILLLVVAFFFIFKYTEFSIFNKNSSKNLGDTLPVAVSPPSTPPPQSPSPSSETPVPVVVPVPAPVLPSIPLITSLTADEKAKVQNAILSSAFVNDLPKSGVISLHFFNYQGGQRVELDTFLIGKGQILTTGTPDIFIILHSKYIPQLTDSTLCDIIKSAKTNGDLGFESPESTTKLFLKYAGMLKYRDCFGI